MSPSVASRRDVLIAEHGFTAYRRKKNPCRCDVCRRANADHFRAYRNGSVAPCTGCKRPKSDDRRRKKLCHECATAVVAFMASTDVPATTGTCAVCAAPSSVRRRLCNRCQKRAEAAGVTKPHRPLNERLDSGYTVNAETGCWDWRRTRSAEGYGHIGSARKVRLTHRLMYERYVGPIPQGYEIDHLCRNRACCNPAHLEAVTPSENQRRGFSPAGLNARKTHCPTGHPYDEENTRWAKRGRVCRTCEKARSLARRVTAA